MHEFNAIITIAYRDIIKFLRNRPRLVISFIFPLIFIGVLGNSLQSNLGQQAGYNFLTFVFTGVIAQTLFQTAANGLISLAEDRADDFTQEMFIAPVSRYSIILGKILGESMVALFQLIGVILFGLLFGVPMTLEQLLIVLPVSLLICLLGGAFGVFVVSQLGEQRTANQIFPLVMLPQFFLAGIFAPIKIVPPFLLILSRLAPMTYAVDFIRNIWYLDQPEHGKIVLYPALVDLGVIIGLFAFFLILGTYLFTKNERNR